MPANFMTELVRPVGYVPFYTTELYVYLYTVIIGSQTTIGFRSFSNAEDGSHQAIWSS